MAVGGSGGDQNYWPGFVDALSNVVLTLVFVLVVFVFALVITSGKVKQKANEFSEQQKHQAEHEAQTMAELQTQVNILQKAVTEANRTIDAKNKVVADAKQAEAEAKAQAEAARKELVQIKTQEELKELAVTPSVVVEKVQLDVNAGVQNYKDKDATAAVRDSAAIVVTFPKSVILLNDRAKAELRKVIARHRNELAGTTAQLRALAGVETYSEGRRLAYYRALDIRNLLIDEKVGTPKTINITTVPSRDNAEGRVEIRFVRPN